MKVPDPIIKIFAAITLLVLFTLKAQSEIIFTGKKSIESVGGQIKYYVDSNSNQTIESIQQTTSFITSTEKVPDFGLLKVPIWLKVEVKNQSNSPNLMLQFEQSYLQTIDIYSFENNVFVVNKSGLERPFNSRMVNSYKFIYKLDIPPGTSRTYYFRIKSILKMRMPISLGQRNDIIENNLSKNICFGIYFGIMLVMFLYNLFIYFVLKESIYLYYVGYIIIVGLVQTTYEGYSFQYFWPDNSFLSTRSFFLLTALVNITGLQFVRMFLHTNSFLPRLDKVSYFLYAVYAIDIFFILKGDFFTSYQIIQAFGGLMSIYILTISLIIAKRGYRPAKFFLLAWLPLIFSIIIWFLGDFNVLPYNTLTNYSMTIGSGLEAILLSFALADKINIFKAEKEKSQEETLKALQENEKLIREQNVVLESKVKERTTELEASNEELSETLDDLKQAQMQLVESEKMASLGQLTAGIAHEINNPITFVTSNVAPLQRDFKALIDVISTIEDISFSDAPISEKQQKIEDYKEEIDFDYLKIEISHLIKGINEGASRTAEIVKGLRVFSRLDEDDLKYADILDGIESTLVIANNLLGGVKVTKNFAELPLIECYPGKLNQVFLNIISNAVHAINKKFGAESTEGEITIETHKSEQVVTIEISDNGTGMNEYAMKKIFEPFFTTKDVGEGTGLGMSIAYNTIKKHKGNIQLHSEIGKGTKFMIDLPLRIK